MSCRPFLMLTLSIPYTIEKPLFLLSATLEPKHARILVMSVTKTRFKDAKTA